VFEYEVEGKKAPGERRVVTVRVVGGVTMQFVRIPAGRFKMGAGETSPRDETPLNTLAAEITDDFYLGKYEVTQEQYFVVMGTNPSAFAKDGKCATSVESLDTRRFPVERVSWDDAARFCDRLTSFFRGKHPSFRLPTEAEWEYACRAGSTGRFCFGDDHAKLEEYAWTRTNSGHRPHEVGTRNPNRFGLYDMHGNVDEWCADWDGPLARLNAKNPARLKQPRDESKHIFRGGNWRSRHPQCTAGYRAGLAADTVVNDQGFRVAFSAR
jgi:formylglycine-generating enzyme required for sulfatase activity